MNRFPMMVVDLNRVVTGWVDLVLTLQPFYGDYRFLSFSEDEDSTEIVIKAEDGEIYTQLLAKDLSPSDAYYIDDTKHAAAMYEIVKDAEDPVIYLRTGTELKAYRPQELLEL